MAYLALYRKYRPRSFDEIVGQQAVVKALRNQVKFGQVGHAYLFCGTRGTGKTSIARVFAKAVNCLESEDGNPCGRCELCEEFSQSLNVIEIDAASNNDVENVRELRDEAVFTPVKGRYKIYIIDEAHMLSTSAFNALLKILEEPPEHVIFILATTEPNKLLPTILSRCQRFDFKRLTADEIRGQLRHVCDEEGLEAEEEALAYMAAAADGGMRDALSLLDQCRAYFIGEPITLEKVLDVLGAVDASTLVNMTAALASADAVTLLRQVDTVFMQGRDPMQLVSSWGSYLRGILMYRVLGDAAEAYVSDGATVRREMSEQARRITETQLTFFIQELSKLLNSLRYAPQKRILLETALVAMASGRSAGSSPDLGARLDQLEARLEVLSKGGMIAAPAPAGPAYAAPAPAPSRPAAPAQAPVQSPASAKPAAASAQPQAPAAASGASDWNALKNDFVAKNPQFMMCRDCQITEREDGALELGVPERMRLFVTDKTLDALGSYLSGQAGRDVKLVIGPDRRQASGPSMQDMLAGFGGAIDWK